MFKVEGFGLRVRLYMYIYIYTRDHKLQPRSETFSDHDHSLYLHHEIFKVNPGRSVTMAGLRTRSMDSASTARATASGGRPARGAGRVESRAR